MILPDVNVLVHTHNVDSALHDRARLWWDACLAGTEGIGLAWAAMLGFVRITTNRRVVARPLPIQRVMERLQAWLALPHVHIAQPSNMHFEGFGLNSSVLGPPATSPRMPTWPSSRWSAGMCCTRQIRISPDLAVCAGSIRAKKPEGHETVKDGTSHQRHASFETAATRLPQDEDISGCRRTRPAARQTAP
jgi:hypothetical protein